MRLLVWMAAKGSKRRSLGERPRERDRWQRERETGKTENVMKKDVEEN